LSRPPDLGPAPSEIRSLERPDLGLRVVRGGTIRGVGYGIGAVLMAGSSVVLLRYLGVDDFGRFIAVLSLMAIVGGVTDAGLATIATRELAILGEGHDRQKLLANLLGIRLVIAPIGVAGGVVFAIAAGYAWSLVAGTALVGIGVLLTAAQSAIAVPLNVDLEVGRVAALDVLRQGGMLVGVVVLAAAHSSLLPFFVVPIAAAGVPLAVTPALVGRRGTVVPKFDRGSWRILIRESLPTAASLVMNIVYFRVLIVLMSVVATAAETGLFAASFRVFELLFGVSALAITVALPALAVAAADRQIGRASCRERV